MSGVFFEAEFGQKYDNCNYLVTVTVPFLSAILWPFFKQIHRLSLFPWTKFSLGSMTQ